MKYIIGSEALERQHRNAAQRTLFIALYETV